MGSSGATAKVQAKEWDKSFEKIIEEVGSIQVSGSSTSAASAP